MRRPYAEFLCISLAEMAAAWLLAVMLDLPLTPPLKVAAGLAGLLLVRYTLRKVFLHDLRGIHGRRNGPRRFAFDAAPAASRAASA